MKAGYSDSLDERNRIGWQDLYRDRVASISIITLHPPESNFDYLGNRDYSFDSSYPFSIYNFYSVAFAVDEATIG